MTGELVMRGARTEETITGALGASIALHLALMKWVTSWSTLNGLMDPRFSRREGCRLRRENGSWDPSVNGSATDCGFFI